MKPRKAIRQVKQSLPEAISIAGRAAADALMHLDTGGKVFMALIWWGIGKAGKRGKKKKRGGKK